MMRKAPPPASPEAYVTALRGWRRDLVDKLRAAVLGAAPFEERIKWGHLVYFSNAPGELAHADMGRLDVEHGEAVLFVRRRRLAKINP